MAFLILQGDAFTINMIPGLKDINFDLCTEGVKFVSYLKISKTFLYINGKTRGKGFDKYSNSTVYGSV